MATFVGCHFISLVIIEPVFMGYDCHHAAVRSWSLWLFSCVALGVLFSLTQSVAAQSPAEVTPPKSEPPTQAVQGPESASVPAAEPTTEESLPVPDKISYEPHIKEIFNQKCIECHGSKQAKANLRVDDREAMLSYIEPGDLESSSLWSDYLMTTDPELRMPPVKSGKQLSPLELAAIRVWIQEGADWPESIAAASDPEVKPTAQFRNNWDRFLHFIGYFHPAIVHFPIALLIVAGLFAVLSWVQRATFEPAAYYCLWLGALGAVLGSLAGWTFADIRGYDDFWSTTWSQDPIARHRNTGIATAVLAILVGIVATVARSQQRTKLRATWLLGTILLAGLVSIVGHQGGELTYGENLLERAYQQAFGDEPEGGDLTPKSEHTHGQKNSSQ